MRLDRFGSRCGVRNQPLELRKALQGPQETLDQRVTLDRQETLDR